MYQLQLVFRNAETYHLAVREENFVKISEGDLAKHSALPLSSVKDTSAIAELILKRLQTWRTTDTGVERKLAELQSLMLKSEWFALDYGYNAHASVADMRSGQLEQFAKARDDPSFVKVIEVTQLSAQQMSDQTRINKAVQDVETGLEDLEMGLSGLKRRVEDARAGVAPG
jgi:nucleoporin NUP159